MRPIEILAAQVAHLETGEIALQVIVGVIRRVIERQWWGRVRDPLPLQNLKIYVLVGYDRPHRQTSQYIPVALQCDGFFIMYQAVRKALQFDR